MRPTDLLKKNFRTPWLCALAFWPLGCGRGIEPSSPLLPTSQPAPQAAAQGIWLEIDGTPTAFPGVELRALGTGNGVAVSLTTMSTGDEAANTLNLEITLEDLEDPADLAGAAYDFLTEDPERADTLNALTLRRGAITLEPMELHLAFASDSRGKLIIQLNGQFHWFEPPDAEAPLKTVTVRGKFTVPGPKPP